MNQETDREKTPEEKAAEAYVEVFTGITSMLRVGPERVVIRADGSVTSCRVARETHNIQPDVIFIRDDGWALGAPKQYAAAAHAMWESKWVAFVVRSRPHAIRWWLPNVHPISEWVGVEPIDNVVEPTG